MIHSPPKSSAPIQATITAFLGRFMLCRGTRTFPVPGFRKAKASNKMRSAGRIHFSFNAPVYTKHQDNRNWFECVAFCRLELFRKFIIHESGVEPGRDVLFHYFLWLTAYLFVRTVSRNLAFLKLLIEVIHIGGLTHKFLMGTYELWRKS